jgi:hypothetical protein
MFLNADIPPIYCRVRLRYLMDFELKTGETTPVCVFGIASIPGRSLGFHCYTEEGAMFWRLPISAFVRDNEDCLEGEQPVELLQCWDCMSYEIAVTEFESLKGLRVRTKLKDGVMYHGRYLFTVDFCNSPMAEAAGDAGHKCAHIILLDNGNFAAQPNNRIFWHEPAFITKPFADDAKPPYKTMSHTFSAETASKWLTEDSQNYFYEVKNEQGNGLAKPILKDQR